MFIGLRCHTWPWSIANFVPALRFPLEGKVLIDYFDHVFLLRINDLGLGAQIGLFAAKLFDL